MVKFPIDCRASCNIMPSNLLNPDNKLEHTNIVLVMYNKSKLKPLGKCKIKIRNPRNDKLYRLEFHVINGDGGMPLLVRRASETMKLIDLGEDDSFIIENLARPGALLPASRLYNLSKPGREAMERYISKSLASGINSSLFVPCRFFFVKKKDSSLRPCINYSTLTDIAVKNKCPLLLIDTAFALLQRAHLHNVGPPEHLPSCSHSRGRRVKVGVQVGVYLYGTISNRIVFMYFRTQSLNP